MTGSYPIASPSPLSAWGFAPSERLALSAAKRVAASCCSHRDKPGGKRCAVLLFSALPKVYSLKPKACPGPPPALCRWSRDWQLPIAAPSPLSAWGFAPSESLALSAAKPVAASCCSHRDEPGGKGIRFFILGSSFFVLGRMKNGEWGMAAKKSQRGCGRLLESA
jgi:hypothetical protein